MYIADTLNHSIREVNSTTLIITTLVGEDFGEGGHSADGLAGNQQTIDSPAAIAELCSEMRFLDRESLRVVLLNAKQHLIKVATVSQGTVNESLAHSREIFKSAIVHSAYSLIMVHNLWVATHKLCYVDSIVM